MFLGIRFDRVGDGGLGLGRPPETVHRACACIRVRAPIDFIFPQNDQPYATVAWVCGVHQWIDTVSLERNPGTKQVFGMVGSAVVWL